MKDLLTLIALLALIFGVIIGVQYLYESAMCSAKTEEMGFESRFSLFGGCQIEVKEGQWIPLESYYFKEE